MNVIIKIISAADTGMRISDFLICFWATGQQSNKAMFNQLAIVSDIVLFS